jgi:acetyl esterase/lipase
VVALLAVWAFSASGCAELWFRGLDAIEQTSDVVRMPDRVFDAEHRLALDVYAPRNPASAPVLVFFYGGSWISGKRGWYRYLGDALAERGVVTLIPDYRKYPAVRFPAFVQDAARAVRYARDHATEFGGDPHRLFVMGHSAGGQIAALLACDARYLAAVGLARQDLAGMIGVAGAYAFLPFVDEESAIFGDDPTGRYDSQPINFVDGKQPPLLLLQGEADHEVPPRTAEIMAERVHAMGGTVTVKRYPGVGHNRILLAVARGQRAHVPTLEDILEFLAQPAGVR